MLINEYAYLIGKTPHLLDLLVLLQKLNQVDSTLEADQRKTVSVISNYEQAYLIRLMKRNRRLYGIGFGSVEARNEFEELAVAIEELYRIIKVVPETQPYQVILPDGSTQYCNTLLALSAVVHADITYLVDLEEERYHDKVNGADHRNYGIFYRVKQWFPN